MRQVLATLLSVTLLTTACATPRAANNRLPLQSNVAVPDRALLTGYLAQLPVGSSVRARLIDGHTVRGTLMKAVPEGIVVQQRTRIPEPPTDIPIETISVVELDRPSGLAKAVGIGAAAGAGAAIGTLMLLAAIFSD